MQSNMTHSDSPSRWQRTLQYFLLLLQLRALLPSSITKWDIFLLADFPFIGLFVDCVIVVVILVTIHFCPFFARKPRVRDTLRSRESFFRLLWPMEINRWNSKWLWVFPYSPNDGLRLPSLYSAHLPSFPFAAWQVRCKCMCMHVKCSSGLETTLIKVHFYICECVSQTYSKTICPFYFLLLFFFHVRGSYPIFGLHSILCIEWHFFWKWLPYFCARFASYVYWWFFMHTHVTGIAR